MLGFSMRRSDGSCRYALPEILPPHVALATLSQQNRIPKNRYPAVEFRCELTAKGPSFAWGEKLWTSNGLTT